MGWTAFAVMVGASAVPLTATEVLAAGSSSVGDTVWWDRDNDGVRDADEVGIPGVEITVTDFGPDTVEGGGDDVVFEPVLTDSEGVWSVRELSAGPFRVSVSGGVPAGMVPTFDADGLATPLTSAVVLDGDGPNATQDFGFAGSGELGGIVWLDANGNTVVDAGSLELPAEENPLAFVEVVVTWLGPDGVPGQDDLVVSAVTDITGGYVISGAPYGEYVVEVVAPTVPDGMVPTFDRDGGLDEQTSVWLADVDGERAVADVDFGYRGTNSIGGTVVWDRDASGGLTTVDTPLHEMVVAAMWYPDCDVAEPAECIIESAPPGFFLAATAADGTYRFDGMPSGAYWVVTFPVPNGLLPSFDADGVGPEAYPGAVGLLASSGEHVTADFGFAGEGRIGDVVYLDRNGDGVQDPGEPGVPGQPVQLLWRPCMCESEEEPPYEIVVETVTGADGSYLFDHSGYGEFRVRVLGGIADAATNTGDPDGDVPHESWTWLDGGDVPALLDHAPLAVAGLADLGQDFGYAGTASLSGTVFNDADRDGVAGSGESGLPGVTVSVSWAGPNGRLTLTTVAAADGSWRLDRLPAGGYTVRLDPASVPAGFDATTPAEVVLVLAPDGVFAANHGFALQLLPPTTTTAPEPGPAPSTVAPAAPAPSTLPATGGNSTGPRNAAIVLLALGVGAMAIARTRRRPVS